MKRVMSFIILSLVLLSSVGMSFANEALISKVSVHGGLIVSGSKLSAMKNTDENWLIRNFTYESGKLSIGLIDQDGREFTVESVISNNSISSASITGYDSVIKNLEVNIDEIIITVYSKSADKVSVIRVPNIVLNVNEPIESNRYWYGEILEGELEEAPNMVGMLRSGISTKDKISTYTYRYTIFGDRVREYIKVKFSYAYPTTKNGNEEYFNLVMKIDEKYTKIYPKSGRSRTKQGSSLFINQPEAHIAVDKGEVIVSGRTSNDCTKVGNSTKFIYSWSLGVPNTPFSISTSYSKDTKENDSLFMFSDEWSSRKQTVKASVGLNAYAYKMEDEGDKFGVKYSIASSDDYGTSGSKNLNSKWTFNVQSISGNGGNYNKSESYSYKMPYRVY